MLRCGPKDHELLVHGIVAGAQRVVAEVAKLRLGMYALRSYLDWNIDARRPGPAGSDPILETRECRNSCSQGPPGFQRSPNRFPFAAAESPGRTNGLISPTSSARSPA